MPEPLKGMEVDGLVDDDRSMETDSRVDVGWT